MIRVVFIDADDNTPVLDIKPYTPSFDRVETPGVPAWCSEWPKSTEVSGCLIGDKCLTFKGVTALFISIGANAPGKVT